MQLCKKSFGDGTFVVMLIAMVGIERRFTQKTWQRLLGLGL